MNNSFSDNDQGEGKGLRPFKPPWYLKSWMEHQDNISDNNNDCNTQIQYPLEIKYKMETNTIFKEIMNQFVITNIICKSSCDYIANLPKHTFVTHGNSTQPDFRLPMSNYKLINPKATIRKFPNGISMCIGTTNTEQAYWSLTKADYSLWRKTQTLPWLTNFSIINVVASVILPHHVNLQKLYEYDSYAFVYDKDVFPGVRFRSSRLQFFSDFDRNESAMLELLQKYKEWFHNYDSIEIIDDQSSPETLENDLLYKKYTEIQKIISKYNETNNNSLLTIEEFQMIRTTLITFWRFIQAKKVYQIFDTGKIIITGAKTPIEIMHDLVILEKYTSRCQIFDYQLNQSNNIDLNKLYNLLQLIYPNKDNQLPMNLLEFCNKSNKNKSKIIEHQCQKTHKLIKEQHTKLQKASAGTAVPCNPANIAIYKNMLRYQNNLIETQQKQVYLNVSFNVNQLGGWKGRSPSSTEPTTDKLTFNIYHDGLIQIVDADNKQQADFIYNILLDKFINQCCIEKKVWIEFKLQDIQHLWKGHSPLWYDTMDHLWKDLHPVLYKNNMSAIVNFNRKLDDIKPRKRKKT